MKHLMSFLALFLVCTSTVFAAPELSDRLQVGEINGPKEVKVIRARGAREEFVSTGETLFVGDEVISSKGQIVGLTAFDGSKWKIAPETRFKIESRKPDKQTLFVWTFQILKGAMWGLVPKLSEEKGGFKLKVHTKSAAMGIRGTEYLMDGDDTRSGLDVLEGTVWWGKDVNFPPGSYREVTAGHHAEIESNGKITISESKGDKTALATRYGLVPQSGPDSSNNPSGTAEECLAKGKGWKSKDGSKVGECVGSKGD